MIRDALIAAARAVRAETPARSALTGHLRALHRREAPRPPIAWRALAQAAAIEGIDLVLFEWMRPALTPDAVRWLDLRLAATRMRHALNLEAAREVLDAFEASGIRAAPLKGPLLAERLYAPPHLRSSVDIDVLVDPASFERASAILVELGYAPPSAEAIAYFRAVHHDVIFFHPTRLPVELHFRAMSSFGASISAADLLGRASVAGKGGAAGGRGLEPDDEFVYLSVHAAAHRFGRLSWVHDLVLFARAYGTRGDHALARARHLRVETPVRAALHALAQIDAPLAGTPRVGPRARLALALPSGGGPVAGPVAQFTSDLLLSDSPRAAFRLTRRKLVADLPWRLRR